jgi:hypothetical protein
MEEESVKKVLYLILKVVIRNNGFISQLEIFKDVRNLLFKHFSVKENDFLIKLDNGKTEDFKDLLNFILTILCELELVTQKLENKSYFFKWSGIRGFRKKYLLNLINLPIKYDLSESFEQRIQIYTRNLLIYLIMEKYDYGITIEKILEIRKQCELDNDQRHIDKIQTTLVFLDFLKQESPNKTSDKPSEVILYKINQQLININLIKDDNFAEKVNISYNDLILMKYKDNEENTSKTRIIINNGELNKKPPTNIERETENEVNELDIYKIPISYYSQENEEVGFALLRGNNWLYYMRKLNCIIGRAPVKHGVLMNNYNKVKTSNTTWLVDIDLGQQRKISKQHALIAYNFELNTFEIKNLSKKFPIKVNGEVLKFNDEALLSSKSLIQISNQEFYFLLPV